MRFIQVQMYFQKFMHNFFSPSQDKIVGQWKRPGQVTRKLPDNGVHAGIHDREYPATVIVVFLSFLNFISYPILSRKRRTTISLVPFCLQLPIPSHPQ